MSETKARAIAERRDRSQEDRHREDQVTSRRTNVAPGHNKEKLGMWFFLGSEVILFTTLILTYGLFRINYANEYPGFKSELNVILVGVNTFILIMSSYFVVRALEAVRQDKRNAFFANLVIVLLLGSFFIAGQAYEWAQLFGDGIGLYSTFGAPFFIVTGIHGTHVLVGLAWASILLFLGMGDSYGSKDDRAMEFFGLYWHFVDIVWIVLFTLIYLL